MGAALIVRLFCPSCGAGIRVASPGGSSGDDTPGPVVCRSCRRPIPTRGMPAAPVFSTSPMSLCPVCGEDKLYVQKRFDQKLGCLVVAVGAALVPWTYGLSLAACALLDWLLFRMLPSETVCYVCGSRYTGPPLNPDHKAYDLMTAQTWEARSIAWRRRNDHSSD